jgi:hypothetical protein
MFADEHKEDYGWLTHEYTPAIMRLFCDKAIGILRRWSAMKKI